MTPSSSPRVVFGKMRLCFIEVGNGGLTMVTRQRASNWCWGRTSEEARQGVASAVAATAKLF